MKTILTMVSAILLAAGSLVPTKTNAATGPEETYVSRGPVQTFNMVPKFNSVVIEDDMDVVLIESTERSAEFYGSNIDVANVQMKVKNGVLYLKSKWGSLKNRVIVTLHVNNLKEIEINGESSVMSIGYLNTSSLVVYMNAAGSANLISSGRITLVNTDGISLEFREKTRKVYVDGKEA